MLKKNKKKDLEKRALTGKLYPVGYRKTFLDISKIRFTFIVEKDYHYIDDSLLKRKDIPNEYTLIYNSELGKNVYKKEIYKISVYLNYRLVYIFTSNTRLKLKEKYYLSIKEASQLFQVNLSELYKVNIPTFKSGSKKMFTPKFYEDKMNLSKWYDKKEVYRKRSLLHSDLNKIISEYNYSSIEEIFPTPYKDFLKSLEKLSSKKDLYEKTEYVY